MVSQLFLYWEISTLGLIGTTLITGFQNSSNILTIRIFLLTFYSAKMNTQILRQKKKNHILIIYLVMFKWHISSTFSLLLELKDLTQRIPSTVYYRTSTMMLNTISKENTVRGFHLLFFPSLLRRNKNSLRSKIFPNTKQKLLKINLNWRK